MKLLFLVTTGLLLAASTAQAAKNSGLPPEWRSFSKARLAITCSTYTRTAAINMAASGSPKDSVLSAIRVATLWRRPYAAPQYEELSREAVQYMDRQFVPDHLRHMTYCANAGRALVEALREPEKVRLQALAEAEYATLIKPLAPQ